MPRSLARLSPRSLPICDHTPFGARHAVVFRLGCWIRRYQLSVLLGWPTLSCSIRLDLLPLSSVAVADTTGVRSLCHLAHTRGIFSGLPQRYLLHFLFLLEWYNASGSGTAVSAFSAYRSPAPWYDNCWPTAPAAYRRQDQGLAELDW